MSLWWLIGPGVLVVLVTWVLVLCYALPIGRARQQRDIEDPERLR